MSVVEEREQDTVPKSKVVSIPIKPPTPSSSSEPSTGEEEVVLPAESFIDYGKLARECHVHIVPDSEIQWGERIGGRALRSWYSATIYGSVVAVARQISPDNPPPSMLKANIIAYSSLHHPNIVALMGISESGHIITELCDQDLSPRDIQNRFERQAFLSRLSLARDLARALAWAHSVGVVHRDVKPSHFLQSRGMAKLGGWLFSETIETLKGMHAPPDDRFHGTPLYMPPELWGREPFDARKADVYSFSLSLWEVIYGKPVFAQYTDITKFRKAVLEEGERPEIGEEMPGALKKMLERGWSENPAERPDMIEVVNTLTRVVEALKVLEG